MIENPWKEILAACMNERLAKIIISGPRKKDGVRKIEIRPGTFKRKTDVSGKCFIQKSRCSIIT